MAKSIGYFQFDNLVRGRVGFVFLNFGVNTSAVYPHIFKMHLENRLLQLPEGELINASPEQVLSAMTTHPKESAIVLLCQDGVRSSEVAKVLESAGFINAFYVHGGWEQLLKEKAQE